MKKKTMLLFDLDGTLWDSARQVAESWNIIFARQDPPLPSLTAGDIHAVMGLTMDQIRDTLWPEVPMEVRKRVFDLCTVFEVEYLRTNCGVLYPGLRPVMEELRARGYALAIVSNCQSGYIGAFLQGSGTGDLFDDTEEWGNTLRPKGENIRLVLERNGFAQGLYIGDTAGDQRAAALAGIPFVHAAYGFGTAQDPAGVIHSLEELPGVLEGMKLE